MPEEAWFNVNMMQKDMLLAEELGRELDVALPTVAISNQILTSARAMGLAAHGNSQQSRDRSPLPGRNPFQSLTFSLSTALLAAPEDGEGMTFNSKFRLVCDGSKLVVGKADIHFDHTMARRAGQVMMMLVAADAVVMRAIGKFDTIQDAHISEFLHGTEDGCPS